MASSQYGYDKWGHEGSYIWGEMPAILLVEELTEELDRMDLASGYGRN